MATNAVPMKPRREMQERKAPELIQFTKEGQILEGKLISIEPVVVKGKEAIEYLFADERGQRMTCLGTADLNKKIHPGDIRHWVKIRYERDDSSFKKEGQSAMKIFNVDVSKEPEGDEF
jgi:hypothetical protein